MKKKTWVIVGIIAAVLLIGILAVVLQSCSVGIIGGADGPTSVIV